jgi:hypothetical protein
MSTDELEKLKSQLKVARDEINNLRFEFNRIAIIFAYKTSF